MTATVGTVFWFRTSTNPAAAWHGGDHDDGDHDDALTWWPESVCWNGLAASVAGVFLTTDLAFFGANVIKIEQAAGFRCSRAPPMA